MTDEDKRTLLVLGTFESAEYSVRWMQMATDDAISHLLQAFQESHCVLVEIASGFCEKHLSIVAISKDAATRQVSWKKISQPKNPSARRKGPVRPPCDAMQGNNVDRVLWL